MEDQDPAHRHGLALLWFIVIGLTAYMLWAFSMSVLRRDPGFCPDNRFCNLYVVLFGLYGGRKELRALLRLAGRALGVARLPHPHDALVDEIAQDKMLTEGVILTLWLAVYAAAETAHMKDRAYVVSPELRFTVYKVAACFCALFSVKTAVRGRAEKGRPAQDQAGAPEADVDARILARLQQGPATRAELQEACSLPLSTLKRHLTRLMERGVVVREGTSATDPNTRYKLNPGS